MPGRGQAVGIRQHGGEHLGGEFRVVAAQRAAFHGASTIGGQMLARGERTLAEKRSTSPSDSAGEQTECPDTGPDSIEAEKKDMERQFKERGSTRLKQAD
jgi:hypothetical protein